MTGYLQRAREVASKLKATEEAPDIPTNWEELFGNEPHQLQPEPQPREPWRRAGWLFSLAHGGIIAKHLEGDFEVYWPFRTNPGLQDCDDGAVVEKANEAYLEHKSKSRDNSHVEQKNENNEEPVTDLVSSRCVSGPIPYEERHAWVATTQGPAKIWGFLSKGRVGVVLRDKPEVVTWMCSRDLRPYDPDPPLSTEDRGEYTEQTEVQLSLRIGR